MIGRPNHLTRCNACKKDVRDDVGMSLDPKTNEILCMTCTLKKIQQILDTKLKLSMLRDYEKIQSMGEQHRKESLKKKGKDIIDDRLYN